MYIDLIKLINKLYSTSLRLSGNGLSLYCIPWYTSKFIHMFSYTCITYVSVNGRPILQDPKSRSSSHDLKVNPHVCRPFHWESSPRVSQCLRVGSMGVSGRKVPEISYTKPYVLLSLLEHMWNRWPFTDEDMTWPSFLLVNCNTNRRSLSFGLLYHRICLFLKIKKEYIFFRSPSVVPRPYTKPLQ